MRYNKHSRCESGALYFYKKQQTIDAKTETGEGYAGLSSVSVSFFNRIKQVPCFNCEK